MNAAATVVIVTRNRCDVLESTIRSVATQTVPLELIVLDDSSTDGTEQLMREQFPTVRYVRSPVNVGPSALRNRGIEMATCNIVFPIDDDAMFISPDTAETTLQEFEHPRVAAVGIPFKNVSRGDQILQRAPDERIHAIHAFVGCAHALRRDLALAVGGFREAFFYMGEEGDLCVRLLDRGYITRCGRAAPMHHLESPKRVSRNACRFARQNDILFIVANVPSPGAWWRVPWTIAGGALWVIRNDPRHLHWHCAGWIRGLRMTPKLLKQRRPIEPRTASLFLQLKRNGPTPLAEFEDQLPAISAPPPVPA